MLAQKKCISNAAGRRYARVPVAVRQPAACSRRQLLLVLAQATKVPSVETLPKLEQGYTYVDVRTPEEFAAGHPPGSINIPFMFRTDSGMQPNPDFLTVMQEKFPDPGEPLIVGCKSGNRSARACAVLAEAKYSNLVDTTDGFDGWMASNLPVQK